MLVDETPTHNPSDDYVFVKLGFEFLRYNKKTNLAIVTAVWVAALIGAGAILAAGVSAAATLCFPISYEDAWPQLWPLAPALMVILGLAVEVYVIQRVRKAGW
jgi:hypothetical protein